MNNSRTDIVSANTDVELTTSSNSKETNSNKNNNYEQYLDLQDEEEDVDTNNSKSSNNGNKTNSVPSEYPLDQFLIQEDEEEEQQQKQQKQQQEETNDSKKNTITEVDAAVAAVAKIVEQEKQENEDSSNSNETFNIANKENNTTNNNVFVEEQIISENVEIKSTKKRKQNGDIVEGETSEVKKTTKKRKTNASNNTQQEEKPLKKVKAAKSNALQAHNRSTPFVLEEDKIIDNVVEKHCKIHNLTVHEFKELIWKNDNKQQKAKTLFWKALMEEFPKRTRSSLYKHVKRRYNNFKDRGKWSAEEDLHLKNLCTELCNQWSEIGQRLGRMPEDCRDRFRNYLKNNENKTSKPKNKWDHEEEQQLSELIDVLILKSFKVYLTLTGEEDSSIKSWYKLLKQVSYFDKELKDKNKVSETSSFNNDIKKDRIMENLILDSINFNKQQLYPKELVTLFNPLREKLIGDEISTDTFKALSERINENKFLMDLKHVINWTFLSDLLGNGRSRIQIRYKWKNVIKSRFEALKSSKEWTEHNLFSLFLKVMEQVSKDFNNGQVYEDEIDWFYVYKIWRKETGEELANDLFLTYRCDPLLLRYIYDFLKQRLNPAEDSTLLKTVVERLVTLTDEKTDTSLEKPKNKSDLMDKKNIVQEVATSEPESTQKEEKVEEENKQDKQDKEEKEEKEEEKEKQEKQDQKDEEDTKKAA